MSIVVAVSSTGTIIRHTDRAPDTTMRTCSRGSATPTSEGMLLGKASATKVNAPIAVDAPPVIGAARTDRQARAGQPATDRHEAVQLRRRGAGDPVGQQDGPRSVALQELGVSDRLPVSAMAAEERGSPAEDIGLPRSEAEAEAVFAAAATAEVFAVVGEAVADVARTSG